MLAPDTRFRHFPQRKRYLHPDYVCRLCHIKGHHIRDCPTIVGNPPIAAPGAGPPQQAYTPQPNYRPPQQQSHYQPSYPAQGQSQPPHQQQQPQGQAAGIPAAADPSVPQAQNTQQLNHDMNEQIPSADPAHDTKSGGPAEAFPSSGQTGQASVPSSVPTNPQSGGPGQIPDSYGQQGGQQGGQHGRGQGDAYNRGPYPPGPYRQRGPYSNQPYYDRPPPMMGGGYAQDPYRQPYPPQSRYPPAPYMPPQPGAYPVGPSGAPLSREEFERMRGSSEGRGPSRSRSPPRRSEDRHRRRSRSRSPRRHRSSRHHDDRGSHRSRRRHRDE